MCAWVRVYVCVCVNALNSNEEILSLTCPCSAFSMLLQPVQSHADIKQEVNDLAERSGLQAKAKPSRYTCSEPASHWYHSSSLQIASHNKHYTDQNHAGPEPTLLSHCDGCKAPHVAFDVDLTMAVNLCEQISWFINMLFILYLLHRFISQFIYIFWYFYLVFIYFLFLSYTIVQKFEK